MSKKNMINRIKKHKHNIFSVLLHSFFILTLACLALPQAAQASDSVLELSRTGGYAELSDADVSDLDYSKDFSVEVLTKIEPHSIGGRWASFIQKSGSRALYLANEPGFAIGTNQGHLESFGQQITAKVGDETNHVTLNSPSLEGYVYAVMAWNAAAKELVLYLNGNESSRNTNTLINPLSIKNSYDLKVGIGTYGSLKRDIFMIRIWNRKLSSSEISSIYNNYNSTGQHILPSGFSENELKSEWLMHETSDAEGSSGTTHIKDTKGTNHLELKDGAEITAGTGYLTVEYPLNGAINVDKAVTLRVKGGISDLGSIIKPLHYYFQIDKSSSFNSPSLKESGWIKHYGKYKPILNVNTQYYWRVKVKDSNETPTESSYTSTQSFTTEGPTNWYVRPGVYSKSASTPVPATGVYGNQDGTSYDDAWNGIREIVWGETGVKAGDNLYVCGDHVYSTTSGDFLAAQAMEHIEESGFSEEYPITIRMDYVEDPGTLYGIWMDNRVNVVWNGPDSNGVYWTDDLAYGAAAEYNGTDYIWLDRESSTTWVGHYGAVYHTVMVDQPWLKDITYVKTTDGSNPSGKIYSASGLGFRFDLGRSKYIKFYKGSFYASTVGKERISTSINIRPPTHIIFDSCKMIYGVTYWLYAGHDYWTFRNNDLSYAGNGIYTVWLDTPLNDGWGASYLLIENNTFKHLGTPEFYHQDAHAVGIQGGRGHIIQGNYIEDTGSAIEFHTGIYPMKDMIIRNNFIKNIRVRTAISGGAAGSGIVVSGENRDDSIGRRTGFKVYNNIVMNTGIGKTESWQGGGIGTNNKDFVEIYNNIVINPAGKGINFGVINAPPQGAVYNNIIVNPGERYVQIIDAPGDWSNFSSDYNLYYPATDFTSDFYFAQSIDRDNNSILADPLFVDPENGNFRLRAGSPAIDAGVDVGLTQDFEGKPIVNRPDIGAYEYVLFPVSAIQNEPKEGRAPLTVSFDGSQSRSPNGNIVSYEWDFGDGSASTKIKTSHIFTSPGEYTVTLTVTDNYGLKDEFQTRITVFEKEFAELPAGCYNNVFNPAKGERALIVVELPKQSHIRLNLYNTRGHRIRELADEEKEADTYKYYWDGKNDNGDIVGSGLYFVHIQAGDYKKTKKIVVVK